MLEIVHDVAPGAPLAFATANLGMASFAANIRALRHAGAKVIVDDIFYFAEPMFQDGVVAQAVNDVVGPGVSYFSAAGNPVATATITRSSPAPSFRRRGLPAAGGSATFLGGTAHVFGGGNVPARDRGADFALALQWDAPFFSVSGPPGAQSDLDVYVLDSTRTLVLGGATSRQHREQGPGRVHRVRLCEAPRRRVWCT